MKSVKIQVLSCLITFILLGCCKNQTELNFGKLLKINDYSCQYIHNGDSGTIYIEKSLDGIVVWKDGSFMKGKVRQNTLETINGWKYYDENGKFKIRYSFWRDCSISRIQEYNGSKLVRDTGILLDF